MLRVIICMLSKNLTEQLTTLNQNQPNDVVSQTNYELMNRFITMYTSQFESILNKQCGKIFQKKCGGTKTIQLKLNCGKVLNICIIDNLFIEIIVDASGNKINIKICIGDMEVYLECLTEGMTYGESVSLTLDNIDGLDKVLNGLVNNQTVISECFETVKKLLKCNLVK
jgi:hypothetical protein